MPLPYHLQLACMVTSQLIQLGWKLEDLCDVCVKANVAPNRRQAAFHSQSDTSILRDRS